MARARNVKPSLFKNELLGVADPMLTILFISLWCLADKKGRLEDRPLRIKAETFPYRDSIDINGYLTELQRLGFIHRYQSNEVSVIQIVNFEKHQNPHHTEKDSELPEYDENSSTYILTVKEQLNNVTAPADSLLLITDSLKPKQSVAKSKNYEDYPDFLEFWSAYPRKDDKKKSFEAWLKHKPNIDVVLNTLSWQKQTEQWTKNNGKYIPLGETYINGHRWEAEPPMQITGDPF